LYDIDNILIPLQPILSLGKISDIEELHQTVWTPSFMGSCSRTLVVAKIL
jgi:hypothetical protein